jgi:hypothetical protein
MGNQWLLLAAPIFALAFLVLIGVAAQTGYDAAKAACASVGMEWHHEYRSNYCVDSNGQLFALPTPDTGKGE